MTMVWAWPCQRSSAVSHRTAPYVKMDGLHNWHCQLAASSDWRQRRRPLHLQAMPS